MPHITIYTTPSCVYCRMSKDFFKKHNVAYEEKDVTVDEQARDAMVEKSGQLGVPVIDIDGAIIVGFDQEEIKQALKIE